MKRKISFGIAVLMILATCLLVSCNSEVSTTAQVNDGKLVYATFDKMSKAIRPSSSSMTISYELDNIDDLYWVYTATKTDGAGTTGQTDGARVPGNTEWKGLGGAIGPFSKGTWTFTVEGYKYIGTGSVETNPTVEQLRDTGAGHQFNLIYVGTAEGVVLNVTNTKDNPSTIDITVYLQTQGGTGTLKIAANSKFFWAANGEGGSALTDLKLKVYDGNNATAIKTITLSGHASAPSVQGDAVYYSNSEDTSINGLASGDHVFKVQVVRTVNNADQVFFEGTVNAKIYAGITTALDTQAIEGLFTYAQFNGTIDDSAVVVVATDTKTTTTAGSVSFETNYTPASGINPSSNKTTVSISISGDTSIITTDASYKLGVETSNIIAAGSKFSVASNSTAVASVDLTLTKTKDETTSIVSEFGDNGAATVTTYIAKNLSGVKFFYENAEFTKVTSVDDLAVNKFYYEESSGKLVFMTNHFSEFYVTSTDKVYDNQANTCYTLDNFNALDVTNIADHEFLLLDAAVANDVDDSRDVFNAGFKWAVIHTPSDLPNTTDFAGGYGTKIEPFLIVDYRTFQNITRMYEAGYNYFKVKDGIQTIDCNPWTPVYMNGSFDGNSVELSNVTTVLFQNVGKKLGEGSNTKDLIVKNLTANLNITPDPNNQYSTGAMIKNIANSGKTTLKNITLHGTIDAYYNVGSFFNYGPTNIDGVYTSFTVELNNCNSDVTLICSTGNSVGGLLGHAYTNATNQCTLTVTNCSYSGHAYLTGTAKLFAIGGFGGDSATFYNCYNTINGQTPSNQNYELTGQYSYIAKVLPEKETNNYTVSKQTSTSKIIVSLCTQFSSYDINNEKIDSLSGITTVKQIAVITNPSSEKVNVFDVFNTVEILTGEGESRVNDGKLTIYTGDNNSNIDGAIRLQVNQYNSSDQYVSAGTIDIAKKTQPTGSWVIY